MLFLLCNLFLDSHCRILEILTGQVAFGPKMPILNNPVLLRAQFPESIVSLSGSVSSSFNVF